MRGLDRRVLLLERAVLLRGDEVDRAWDAVLDALSTDELRAVLVYIDHKDSTGARAEHLERALGAMERAGGVTAVAAAELRGWACGR